LIAVTLNAVLYCSLCAPCEWYLEQSHLNSESHFNASSKRCCFFHYDCQREIVGRCG